MHEEQPTVPPRAHLAVVAPTSTPPSPACGSAASSQPRREHWGSPRAHAVAPGGHRVELMAAPPYGTGL